MMTMASSTREQLRSIVIEGADHLPLKAWPDLKNVLELHLTFWRLATRHYAAVRSIEIKTRRDGTQKMTECWAVVGTGEGEHIQHSFRLYLGYWTDEWAEAQDAMQS